MPNPAPRPRRAILTGDAERHAFAARCAWRHRHAPIVRAAIRHHLSCLRALRAAV